MNDTTNPTGMNAPALPGTMRPANAPIVSPKAIIEQPAPSDPDPVADGLNSAMAEVRAQINTLRTERNEALRMVPTDPKGGALKLKPLDAQIAKLTDRLNTWADVLAQHNATQAASREKARRVAYKALFALPSASKQGAPALAAEVDRCMAATLDAWRAYLANGTETWQHATAALLAAHGEDPDWNKFMDANLRHSRPCTGNGPDVVATMGRFVHRLVEIVGGDAHHALHDPRLAYMVGPRDLAEIAADHVAHVAEHFTPDAQ